MTTQLLKKKLDYDPITGIFIHKLKGGSRVKPGDIAGSKTKAGYLRVVFNKKEYLLHRLAWQYSYDEIPKVIDHLDRDRLNNSITNLRNTTSKENSRNTKMHSRNTTNYTGIYLNRSKKPHTKIWEARIHDSDKLIHLGCFYTKKEAIAARAAGEKLYKYHVNHGKGKE